MHLSARTHLLLFFSSDRNQTEKDKIRKREVRGERHPLPTGTHGYQCVLWSFSFSAAHGVHLRVPAPPSETLEPTGWGPGMAWFQRQTAGPRTIQCTSQAKAFTVWDTLGYLITSCGFTDQIGIEWLPQF